LAWSCGRSFYRGHEVCAIDLVVATSAFARDGNQALALMLWTDDRGRYGDWRQARRSGREAD
jgi:hypothetical protein